jgi:hypothetical protein
MFYLPAFAVTLTPHRGIYYLSNFHGGMTMPMTIKLYKEAIRAFSDCKKRKSAKFDRRRKCHGLKKKKRKRYVCKKRCKMLVYGYDGRRIHPIKTDKRGILQVKPAATKPTSRTFHEEVFRNTMARSDLTFLPTQETAVQITYSYAVLNRSRFLILACVEISPDGEHFTVDREVTVDPGNLAVIVPATFLRYTRIGVRTVQPQTEPAVLDVYYQTQSAS